VTFWADPKIFSVTEFHFDSLSQRLRELSFLNPGVRISIVDERTEKKHDFAYEGGIRSFVEHLNKAKQPIHDKVIFFQDVRNGTSDPKRDADKERVEVAIQWNEGYAETLFSFTNTINNRDGGTHVEGFKTALTRAIQKYAEANGLTKGLKETTLSGDDCREGLTAVVSVKVRDPKFSSQTKTSSSRPRSRRGCSRSSTTSWGLTWRRTRGSVRRSSRRSSNRPARARRLARRGARPQEGSARLRRPSRKARRLPGEGSRVLGALHRRGDSAGGSAKMGRDRRSQAILPLRGKILNVEKARLDKMLASAEIRTLITALGAGISTDFDANKVRYHKIVIMTDADVDGSHIRTLLLTFFFRHMAMLIDKGYLYIAQPPLYKIAEGRRRRT
jgi:DNA gyrase subunit B